MTGAGRQLAMNPTRQKILETAEILFADQGFGATSLRQITERAGVNLAAVNYHFGSRLELIREVLKRRLDRLNGERRRRLASLEAAGAADLDAVLEALIEPALELSRDERLGGMRFIRLIARAYAENDRELHRFLRDHYSGLMKRFAGALAAALPGLDQASLRWHLDFVIGALTYAMADFGGHFRHLNQIRLETEVLTRHLVDFAAAGLRAAESRAVPPAGRRSAPSVSISLRASS